MPMVTPEKLRSVRARSSEFAAIENQDSDLAKLLLETIPDINDDGTPIPGSFIGLSGFNASMMAMKN